MPTEERRRHERHPVDMGGELFLSGGRCIPIRIVNLGELGALVAVTDLEVPVLEGERAVLRYPRLVDGAVDDAWLRSPGSIVRVELDFAPTGVSRNLAVYFDGGAPPEGYTAVDEDG